MLIDSRNDSTNHSNIAGLDLSPSGGACAGCALAKEPAKKPHLSPTQLDLGCKCGEAWRRSYVEGEKIPPGVAALQGKGVHAGAAVNFEQKIQTHADLPPGQIIDAAVAEFEKEIAGGYTLTDYELARGESRTIGKAADQVASMARTLAEQVVADYQPVLVEQPVRLLLPNASHDILGILDMADDQRRVIDFKTSGKKKQQREADESVQLTYYSAAHKVATGELASEVRLEVLIRKSMPERQTLISHRDGNDYGVLASRINAMLRMVSAGVFMPAAPGSWYCSERWCGYWKTCPYVNAERVALAELRDRGQPLPPLSHGDQSHESRFIDPALFVPPPANKKRVSGTVKERLWRENPHCHWCGRQVKLRQATTDHKVPRAQGGTNHEFNLCLSCQKCNGLRGDSGLRPEHVTA